MLGVGPVIYAPEAAVKRTKARIHSPATQSSGHSSPSLPKVNSHDGGNVRMSDEKVKKSGFMGKIFGRQNSVEKDLKDLGCQNGNHQDELHPFDPMSSLNLQPCPYIRPTAAGMRMVAREETPLLLTHTRSPASPNPYSDTLISRCRARAAATSMTYEEWQAFQKQLADNENHQMVENKEGEYRVIFDIERQHNFVVLSAAPVGDATAVNDWSVYIKFYSQGYFNLSCPPPPPTRGSTFEYLQAVYPPNEEARFTISGAMGDIVSKPTPKACEVLSLAMSRYQTKHASLSFFDNQYETFMIERIYRVNRIERAKSIAAHVLLSTDGLVVLDTQLDWRFQYNPYVIGNPGIRFYAGAPMLATTGEIVGVLSIYGKEPRSGFSPSEKRELGEMANAVIADIEHIQAQYLAAESDYNRLSKRATQLSMLPQALRFHKPASPDMSEEQSYFQTQSDGSAMSRSLSEDQSYYQRQSEFSARTSRELEASYVGNYRPQAHRGSSSADSNFSNDYSDFQELMTPRLGEFRKPSPRPFSSSDLTSIDGERPNTPNRSTFFMDEDDDCHRRFGYTSVGMSALSINSFGEGYGDESILTSSFLRERHVDTPRSDRTLTRQSSFKSMLSISTVLSSRIGAPNDDDDDLQYRRRGSDVTDDNCFDTIDHHDSKDDAANDVAQAQPTSVEITQDQPYYAEAPASDEVTQNQSDYAEAPASDERIRDRPYYAEAKFSCAFTAASLHFDLVYVVHIEPTRPFMSNEELLRDGGAKMTILASHGMKNMALTPEIHIGTLRNIYDITYFHNSDEDYLRETGCHEFGVLVPLSHDSDGPRRDCDSGIVFGAFRKPSFNENGRINPCNMNAAGIEAAARALKIILFDYPKGQQRPSTDPTTPTFNVDPTFNNTGVVKALGRRPSLP